MLTVSQPTTAHSSGMRLCRVNSALRLLGTQADCLQPSGSPLVERQPTLWIPTENGMAAISVAVSRSNRAETVDRKYPGPHRRQSAEATRLTASLKAAQAPHPVMAVMRLATRQSTRADHRHPQDQSTAPQRTSSLPATDLAMGLHRLPARIVSLRRRLFGAAIPRDSLSAMRAVCSSSFMVL